MRSGRFESLIQNLYTQKGQNMRNVFKCGQQPVLRMYLVSTSQRGRVAHGNSQANHMRGMSPVDL